MLVKSLLFPLMLLHLDLTKQALFLRNIWKMNFFSFRIRKVFFNIYLKFIYFQLKLFIFLHKKSLHNFLSDKLHLLYGYFKIPFNFSIFWKLNVKPNNFIISNCKQKMFSDVLSSEDNLKLGSFKRVFDFYLRKNKHPINC